ncbi:heme utilization protein [Bifidobacterium gallicum DSM 20093 = LMG 11596]|uniref:Heme utilization protein n=3 Tax=Bifidobacterium gallicum TaxID=78342 RepID=A0A087AJP4_9BIFI|nr:heme utilization protein [Bifidobacterium gallicum DSM 20093 = LMG 11596]
MPPVDAAPEPSPISPMADPAPRPNTPYTASTAPSAPYGSSTLTVATRPMSATTKRNLLLGAIAAGFLIICGIVLGIVNATVFSEKAVANEYLTAIASGDYAKANTLANPQLDAEQSVLLTNAAAGDANSHISNVQITKSQNNGAAKVLTVTYTLGGKQWETELKMSKQGRKALLFMNWVVAEPLIAKIQVSYPNSLDSITINGVKVSDKNSLDPADSDYSARTFAVYPGKYTASAGKSKYLDSKNASIVASITGSNPDSSQNTVTGRIAISPTDDLVEAIQNEVNATIDTCAKSKDNEPAGCPFGTYMSSYDKYRNFSWTVSDYPTVTESNISMEEGSFAVNNGRMKYTYESKSSSGWTPEQSSTSIGYMSGSFAINGDSVDVTVDEDDDYY